jgi:hypothetical protein
MLISKKPFYASVALSKRDRKGIYEVPGPNQSSYPMFYVYFLKLKLKWMALKAIKSITIYLWFGVIL